MDGSFVCWIIGIYSLVTGACPLASHELRTHLTAAGFRNIAIHRNEQRHWLCVAAEK